MSITFILPRNAGPANWSAFAYWSKIKSEWVILTMSDANKQAADECRF